LAIRIYFDKKNHVIVKFESRDEALVTMNMIEKNVEAATMPSIESKLMDIDCELAVLRDHLVPSGWD
jgi:hypothetical protein